jgi:hypothetical protein
MSLELAEKGIEEDIFKQVPATLVFQTMSGLVETAVRYLRLFKETQEDTEFKNRLFEMAWDAISKNKI